METAEPIVLGCDTPGCTNLSAGQDGLCTRCNNGAPCPECGRGLTRNLKRCTKCAGGPSPKIIVDAFVLAAQERRDRKAGRPKGSLPLGEGAKIKVCHDPSRELGLS